MTVLIERADDGLQPERTALAWRRTLVAFLGAAAFIARILIDSSAVGAAITACLGLTVALGLAISSHRRLARIRSQLDRQLPAGVAHIASGLMGICLLVGAAGATATVLIIIQQH